MCECVYANATRSCQNTVETLIASSLQERSLQDSHWLLLLLLSVEERGKVGSKCLSAPLWMKQMFGEHGNPCSPLSNFVAATN